MSAPNPTVGAQPGWRGTDPDGGTWVLADPDGDDGRPWFYCPAKAGATGWGAWRTWAEAEAADLVPLVAETGAPDYGKCTGAGDCDSRDHYHGCFADLDGAHCDEPGEHTAAPAPLDPEPGTYTVVGIRPATAEEIKAAKIRDEAFEAGVDWANQGNRLPAAPLDPGNPEHLRQVAEFIETMAVGWQRPAEMKVSPVWLREEAERLDRKRAKAAQDAADRKQAEESADGLETPQRQWMISGYLAGIRAGRAEAAS